MTQDLLPYIKPRDIYEFSLSDPTGHEQKGQHPAIVIAVHNETQLCTVIPLTSQADATRFPCTFQIECSRGNGLTNECIALVFQTTCVSFDRLGRKRGTLEQMQYDRVMHLLKQHLKF